MPRLLVVHHSPTPSVSSLTDAVLAGAADDAIEGVEVVVRAALEADADDVLAADGYLFGTPANFGYMSGALKHFFDTIYYPCLEDTVGRPYGLYVHGNDDTTGAVRDIERIVTGLRWTLTQPVLALTGPPGRADIDAAWELGAATAATIAEGLA